jgi:hypothetical protein
LAIYKGVDKSGLPHLFKKIISVVMLARGTLQHLQRPLQCINYIILEFTPSTSLNAHAQRDLETFREEQSDILSEF